MMTSKCRHHGRLRLEADRMMRQSGLAREDQSTSKSANRWRRNVRMNGALTIGQDGDRPDRTLSQDEERERERERGESAGDTLPAVQLGQSVSRSV
jgi:hypothetical protein